MDGEEQSQRTGLYLGLKMDMRLCNHGLKPEL